MSQAAGARRPTLWEVAEIVIEETDRAFKGFGGAGFAGLVSCAVLVRLIRKHATNLEIVGAGPVRGTGKQVEVAGRGRHSRTFAALEALDEAFTRAGAGGWAK